MSLKDAMKKLQQRADETDPLGGTERVLESPTPVPPQPNDYSAIDERRLIGYLGRLGAVERAIKDLPNKINDITFDTEKIIEELSRNDRFFRVVGDAMSAESGKLQGIEDKLSSIETKISEYDPQVAEKIKTEIAALYATEIGALRNELAGIKNIAEAAARAGTSGVPTDDALLGRLLNEKVEKVKAAYEEKKKKTAAEEERRKIEQLTKIIDGAFLSESSKKKK